MKKEKTMNLKENFSEIFLKEDMEQVIQGYEKFRQKAIIDRQRYENLLFDLSNEREIFCECSWKRFVYDAFVKFGIICGDIDNKNKREDLINEIVNLLVLAKEKVRFASDSEVRFGLLKMMIDMIGAFANKIHKIQYAAMIYDIMNDMNKDREFYSFYEEDGLAYVVKCTAEVIYIISKVRGIDAEDWIQEVVNQANQNFVTDFGNRLLEENKLVKRKEVKPYKTMSKKQKKYLPIVAVIGGIVLLILIGFGGGFLCAKIVDNSKLRAQEEQIQILNNQIEQLQEKRQGVE